MGCSRLPRETCLPALSDIRLMPLRVSRAFLFGTYRWGVSMSKTQLAGSCHPTDPLLLPGLPRWWPGRG